MTKAEQARVTAWRLRILRSALDEPRLVAQTCRRFGISRTAFYAVVSKILYLRQQYHFGKAGSLITSSAFTR